MSQKLNRLPTLDGVRAISALIVVVYHLQAYSGLHPYLTALPQVNGRLGVDLFFAISGFVICRGLIFENLNAGKVSLPAFYIRRIFRILPALGLYILAVMSLAAMGLLPADSTAAYRGLLFYCNIGHCGGYVGGHLWSLSVEEQFYLVIPLLFLLAPARHRWVFTASAVILPLAVIALYAAKQTAAARFLSDFTIITAGVAAAVNEQAVRRLVSRIPLWCVVVLAIAVVGSYSVPASPLVTLLWVLLIPPAVVLLALYPVFHAGKAFDWLRVPPIQAVGLASYSLYLWQQLATYQFKGVGPWFYCLSIPLCILGALASYRWLERPLVRFGARLSAAVSKPIAAQTRA